MLLTEENGSFKKDWPMSKIALIVLAVIVIGGALYGINRGNRLTTDSPNVTSSNITSASQPKEQTVQTTRINIQSYAFTPAAISVSKGSSVVWTNDDTVAHTIVENDSLNGPSSQQIEPGQSYSFKFSQSGTFHYHCSLHPDMAGSVSVN